MKYIKHIILTAMAVVVMTGAWAQTEIDPDPYTPTQQTDGSWQFTMPAANKLLEVENYNTYILTLASNDNTMGTVKLLNSYTLTFTGVNSSAEPIVIPYYYGDSITLDRTCSQMAQYFFGDFQYMMVSTPPNISCDQQGLTVKGVFADTQELTLGNKTIQVTCTPNMSNVIKTGDNEYTVIDGAVVTVKATPADNYRFVNWTDENSNVMGTAAQLTFTVTGDTTVTGNFAVRPVLKLATNDPAMGTVKIDSAGGSGEKTIIPYNSIESDSCSGCVVCWPGEGSDKLFDGNTSSGKWSTDSTVKFVVFHTDTPVQVNGYTLFTGNDNADQHGRNPKSWVLKARAGASDSWTTVATVTDDHTMQDVNYTPFDFEMDVPGTYQYFRFEVSALRGSGNFMQLGEMQLFNRAISFLDSVSVKNAAANEYYVLPGAKVAVKAIPAAGYQLLKWEDNSTDLDRTVTVTGDTIVRATFGLPTPGVTPEGNLTVFGGRFLSETGEIVATPALTETGGLIDESVVPVPVINGVDLSALTDNYVANDGDTLTGTLNANVKISIAAGATVTLAGVTINGTNSNDYKWAGITCEGNATIILMDGTENTVKGFYDEFPGIYVPVGSTLTIQGGTSGTGALITSSNGNGAGIGGGWKTPYNSCGNINIQGGNVTAYGGYCLAGIGGGRDGSCGTINITGGNVSANGGDEAAGIGGSQRGSCGTIEISGGTVLSNGGKYGAGIGSGYAEFGPASCGNIHISGGTITATGGKEAAGIGGGKRTTNYVTQCGTITITAGVTSVTATKGQEAPNSIGAGSGGTCGTVTIEPGANVTQN